MKQTFLERECFETKTWDILMLILTPADRWVSWRELRGCLISTWWPPSSPGNADSTSTSLLPSQPEDSWRKSIHFIYLDWIIEISIERKLFSLKNLTLEHHSPGFHQWLCLTRGFLAQIRESSFQSPFQKYVQSCIGNRKQVLTPSLYTSLFIFIQNWPHIDL